MHCLGTGQFGAVHKAVWKAPNKRAQDVAVKIICTTTVENRVKLLQEAAIMSQFTHPNIIRLFAVTLCKDSVSYCSYIG